MSSQVSEKRAFLTIVQLDGLAQLEISLECVIGK